MKLWNFTLKSQTIAEKIAKNLRGLLFCHTLYNRFHERLANNGEYHSLMPSCAGFLEPRKSRVKTIEIFVQCWKFHMQLLHVCLSWFWCNSLLKCVSQPEIARESIKPPFWRARSSKVVEFGGNRQPVYDFLLVINSNLGPISHRYWDTATYWLTIATFSYLLSFSAFVQSDPLRIYGKALRILKLESSKQTTVKIW